MTWLLAIVGLMVLIVLHEAGHFAAAKAVGMRVERFMLFFGRPLVSVRRGETEYGIGPIPLGGYVKISGMNPHEPLPPDVAPRSYYRQPVWKRIVVIAAGPLVNVLIAFVVLWVVFFANGTYDPTSRVAASGLEQPAASYLRAGDRIVSVDGKAGGPDAFQPQVAGHRCAGKPTNGCEATTTAHVVVVRDGRTLAFDIRPRYDAAVGRTRLGFGFDTVHHSYGAGGAAGKSVATMWDVTSRSVSVFTHLFEARERKQVSSVVGVVKITRQAISIGVADALWVFALISLALAIINLFPFLPLDGGHIFWAVVEKLRRRPVPFSLMERASAIGIALILVLFLIGVSNDLAGRAGGG
jgi:regulator of sigma E protease